MSTRRTTSVTAGRKACNTALTRNESAKASPNIHTPLRNFGRPKVLLGAPGLSERSTHIAVISAKSAHKVEPRLHVHFRGIHLQYREMHSQSVTSYNCKEMRSSRVLYLSVSLLARRRHAQTWYFGEFIGRASKRSFFAFVLESSWIFEIAVPARQNC